MSLYCFSRSSIRVFVLSLLVSAAITGCQKSPDAVNGNSKNITDEFNADVEMDVDTTEPWQGIYVSTSEIRGFSGTAIAIGPELNGKRTYREHFYSCIGPPTNPLVPVCETNGNELTITKVGRTQTLNSPTSHRSNTKRNIHD